MEAKYERIIISSLNGYALYLSKVPLEQIEKFKNINQEIISSPKFWKFSKFKTPAVSIWLYWVLFSLNYEEIFYGSNQYYQI